MTFSRADVDSTVPARFDAVVRTAGERIALSGDGRQWTYRALDASANRIAHAVVARTPRGVGCVGYVIEQSPEMVVATLGVLKAGKAYLSAHPAAPLAAQAEIVRDAAPELIIATAETRARAVEIAAGTCPVLTIEEIDGMGERGAVDDPHRIAAPDDPATIFFTSGTTGRPKGVVRSHRAVLHRAWLSLRHEGITASDRQSLLTHASFGASQADLAGALLLGARLCVFDVVPEGLTSFADWIDREGITLLRPPVQLFRRFLAGLDADRRFPQVRLVTLGGDTVLVADIAAWRRHSSPQCAVLHRLSTTETSLLTSRRIEYDTALDQDTLSAGRPVDDIELTLVDPEGQPVPVGASGEVVVSSAYLADGYWRAPDDTARAFTDDPGRPGWRIYRTGDLGRFLPDGRLVFEGRRDHQVKIRGYRVEIGEVEAGVRQLADIADAAVVAVKHEGEQQLFAFVVVRDGQRFDAGSIRQQLATTLPEWKVPARVRQLPALPTTANGKLDRRTLQEIALVEAAAPQHADSSVVDPPSDPPIDDLERQIATIFQRVLRCGPLDRSSDFFVLGGDSLQATVLHQQVERAIGRPFPLEALIKDASVRGIADVVRLAQQSAAPDASARPPVLVPLRSTGRHAALFLVHGRLGQAFVSPHFLEIFGVDQPVYAFQVPGLDPARIPNHTIAEMAAEYIRAMRVVQPAGPYLLGAACAGALIAVEMANQLGKVGDRVGPLLLIDPPVVPPGDLPWWPRAQALARAYAKRWVPRALLERRLVKTQRSRAGAGRMALQFQDRTSLHRAVDAVLIFEIARLKYRRWTYDGPVLMLRSATRFRQDGPSKRGAFGRHLRGDVQWFNVGGNHYSVRDAGNQLMADSLAQAINIARTAVAELRRHAR